MEQTNNLRSIPREVLEAMLLEYGRQFHAGAVGQLHDPPTQLPNYGRQFQTVNGSPVGGNEKQLHAVGNRQMTNIPSQFSGENVQQMGAATNQQMNNMSGQLHAPSAQQLHNVNGKQLHPVPGQFHGAVNQQSHGEPGQLHALANHQSGEVTGQFLNVSGQQLPEISSQQLHKSGGKQYSLKQMPSLVSNTNCTVNSSPAVDELLFPSLPEIENDCIDECSKGKDSSQMAQIAKTWSLNDEPNEKVTSLKEINDDIASYKSVVGKRQHALNTFCDDIVREMDEKIEPPPKKRKASDEAMIKRMEGHENRQRKIISALVAHSKATQQSDEIVNNILLKIEKLL